jgi:hypothetical protein
MRSRSSHYARPNAMDISGRISAGSSSTISIRGDGSRCGDRAPASRLDLRPEFPFQRLAGWAYAHGAAKLIERRKLKPLGLYTLVRLRGLGEVAT